MTNLELLDILGGVNGKYILEAQKMREGRKKAPRRALFQRSRPSRLSRRRPTMTYTNT